MLKSLSTALALLVLPLAALAVDAAEPPVESRPIGILVFVVLFVGGIAVFGWMIWRNEKKKSKQGKS